MASVEAPGMQRESGAAVAIVGAGLIGLGIAFELARRGATVRVVDANEPAGAASWAGAGMLAPHTESLGSEELQNFGVASLARYPDFVAAVRELSGVDANLSLDGIIEAAYDEGSERRGRGRVAGWVARGIPARWLNRDEAYRLEPALGTSVRGAACCDAEGHVDNRRLGRALRAACEALGVRIDANAGYVAIEADPRRVLGVRGPHGFIPADAVVNAAGAWAGELTGVPPFATVRTLPVKGQMLALAAPRGLVRRPLWLPGAYVVPRADGRLLVGATVEAAGFDVRVTAGGLRGLLDAAVTALPALANLSVAETWAGLRPGSADGLPYIGATALEGYYVASGHYRNGILLTPATADLLADVLEARSPGIAAFSPQRDHEASATVAK